MKQAEDQDLAEVIHTSMKLVVDQLVEKWVEPETAMCMVTLMRPPLAAKRDLSALQ